MAGDIWEQAVETFLAMDRGLFLNPQCLIGTPGVWEADPDFLALVFPEQQAWMVEVTKRPGRGLLDKIKQYDIEYAPRIRAQLQHHKIISGDNWSIGLWIFVPDVFLEKTKSSLATHGVKHAKVTTLEETLKATAWESRFR